MNEHNMHNSESLINREQLNDDLLDLHEAILDENIDDVKAVIRRWQASGLCVPELLHKEIELEPTEKDHKLNQLPLSTLHRAALNSSESILSFLLTCQDHVNPNLPLSTNSLTPLHVSAIAGSTVTANYLASNGACVTSCDSHGRMPIHLAVQQKQTDLLKVLVVKGSCIDATDGVGKTPLHQAAEAGSKEAAVFLISRQAKVDAIDKIGQTPLHKAARVGHADVLQLLLSKGSAVNRTDIYGYSPLHESVGYKRRELAEVKIGCDDWFERHESYCIDESERLNCMRALIGHKANIDVAAKDGTTPLHLATATGLMELVKELINSGASVNKPDNSGITAIFLAGSMELLTVLLQNNAIINQKVTDSGNTLLHAYADDENIPSEMITELIARGANVNAINCLGETPVFVSCKRGNFDKTETLLSAGSCINATASNGQTLLHAALWSKNSKLACHLMQNPKIAFDVLDTRSMTPLDVAIEIGDLECVKLLTEKLTERGQTGMGGATPGNLALKLEKYDVFRELLHRGWSYEESQSQTSPLLIYTGVGDLKTCKILCRMNGGVNDSGKNGQTSLHLAALRGDTDLLSCLLEAGADVNLVDEDGCSPLFVACSRTPQSIRDIRLLITYGASMNNKNVSGQTPLHVCMVQGLSETFCITSWEEAVNELVCSGSDLNIADSNGNTPLLLLAELAVAATHVDVRACSLAMLRRFLSQSSIDPNMTNSSGKTLLMYCAQISSGYDLGKYLIGKRAAIESADVNGMRALHYACLHGNVSFVSLLLRYRCSLNVLDKKARSELYYVTESKSSEIFHELITAGSNINLRDNLGSSLLHHSLLNKADDISESLIELIEDINAQDSEGNLPIHIAASISSSLIVASLLSCDALVNARNKKGQTPLLCSVSNPDVGVMKILIANGASIDAQDEIQQNSALHLSSLLGYHGHVNLLLVSHAKHSLLNANGDTALHLAAGNTDSDIIELLIANEASINIQNKQGHTPLALALKSDNVDGALVLLDQQPDVSLTDKNGDTLLHHCVSMSRLNIAFLKRFLSLGCSGNIRNSTGKSPLNLLLSRKDAVPTDLITMLQSHS